MSKSLKELELYLTNKLNNERGRVGGARADVVLIISYSSDISKNDKDYCLQTISRMREHIPGKVLCTTLMNCLVIEYLYSSLLTILFQIQHCLLCLMDPKTHGPI